MCKSKLSCITGSSNMKDIGLVFLRLGVGIPFFFHGLGKLMAIAGTTGFFASIGLPSYFVYIVGILEMLAGISIVFGIYAWVSGYIVSIIMACAYILVKHKGQFMGGQMSYEIDFVFFFLGLAIAYLGSGRYSLLSCACSGDCKDKCCATNTNCDCLDNGGCNTKNCTDCNVCETPKKQISAEMCTHTMPCSCGDCSKCSA